MHWMGRAMERESSRKVKVNGVNATAVGEWIKFFDSAAHLLIAAHVAAPAWLDSFEI